MSLVVPEPFWPENETNISQCWEKQLSVCVVCVNQGVLYRTVLFKRGYCTVLTQDVENHTCCAGSCAFFLFLMLSNRSERCSHDE